MMENLINSVVWQIIAVYQPQLPQRLPHKVLPLQRLKGVEASPNKIEVSTIPEMQKKIWTMKKYSTAIKRTDQYTTNSPEQENAKKT